MLSNPSNNWKVKVKLLSHVRLFATPWTVDYQAPPSSGFSRKIPQAAGCGHKPTNQPKQKKIYQLYHNPALISHGSGEDSWESLGQQGQTSQS